MCTVTVFYKGQNDFIITSNRDESPDRVSLPPALFEDKGVSIFYPKDELSGGTWIGVGNNKRLLCLLNGGFKPHTRKSNYRKSRGIVVKEILLAEGLLSVLNIYDFTDVEPFTLICVEWTTKLEISEMVWDGEKSHLKQYPLGHYIWSSSTLYSDAMKNERVKWFESHKSRSTLNAESVLDFHKQSQNNEFGVVMDRGSVRTTSITQVVKKSDEIKMCYFDLVKNKTSVFNFNSSLQLHEE